MSKLSMLALSFSLFACATGSTMIDPEAPSYTAAARLELGVTANGDSAFPHAIEPRVPSVDRLGVQVRAALGDTATAALQLCVSPAGKVTKVELVESSTFAAFDAALLRDAKAWQFATLPGPEMLQTCSRATVSYHPYE